MSNVSSAAFNKVLSSKYPLIYSLSQKCYVLVTACFSQFFIFSTEFRLAAIFMDTMKV